jgi:hypothetical protein
LNCGFQRTFPLVGVASSISIDISIDGQSASTTAYNLKYARPVSTYICCNTVMLLCCYAVMLSAVWLTLPRTVKYLSLDHRPRSFSPSDSPPSGGGEQVIDCSSMTAEGLPTLPGGSARLVVTGRHLGGAGFASQVNATVSGNPCRLQAISDSELRCETQYCRGKLTF